MVRDEGEGKANLSLGESTLPKVGWPIPSKHRAIRGVRGTSGHQIAAGGVWARWLGLLPRGEVIVDQIEPRVPPAIAGILLVPAEMNGSGERRSVRRGKSLGESTYRRLGG